MVMIFLSVHDCYLKNLLNIQIYFILYLMFIHVDQIPVLLEDLVD